MKFPFKIIQRGFIFFKRLCNLKQRYPIFSFRSRQKHGSIKICNQLAICHKTTSIMRLKTWIKKNV